MTVETEISTPVDETVEDNSLTSEPEVTDTSDSEPETEVATAETETQGAEEKTQSEVLLAGKFKTQQDLENGYKELETLLGKPNEYKLKYEKLLEEQAKAEKKAQEARLKEANKYGFKTVEDQEAHEKLQATELEWYANYLNLVEPESYENARAYLGEYLRTGQIAYLNEAKKLYPLDFVENVRDAKTQLSAKLQSEIEQKRQKERDEFDKNLANQIKDKYAEFLADNTPDSAKSRALKVMCEAGVINSLEDMQNFVDLYTSIVDSAKESALKEYQAQKAIDETKQKAVIGSNSVANGGNTGLKESYTAAEIGAMSQAEYNALTDKYGELELMKRIK